MNNTVSHLYKIDMEKEGREYSELILTNIYQQAETIARKVVVKGGRQKDIDHFIDDIVTSKYLGIPVMLILLALVFFITIVGANYPSLALFAFFNFLEDKITRLLLFLGCPDFIYGFLVQGVYRCTTWVVAVMLPPMAIFFPLFTLLEDAGYLPRVAFNLDSIFNKVGTCGKQALTMCMGFGCNAAGVTSCRIIDSPRERMIAVLTNNFVPCNGRFPLFIALSIIFWGGMGIYKNFIAAFCVAFLVLTGILTTFFISFLLTKTLLKGMPSSFALELPPYRKPVLGQVIVRSILDRIIFVLMRAVKVAAPAGALIWLMANTMVGDASLFKHMTNLLDFPARIIGIDGVILTAFILGLPANELVLPLMLMGYLATGTMIEVESLTALKKILVEQQGWTAGTAVCVMLFSLLHYPCATTLWTVKKETGSLKWAVLAFIIPLVVAICACFMAKQMAKLIGI
ncbi:ferrous iron transport protein B [Thermosyntropha lipolytica DSM 11003]|uniref:Ferrous iron transport protein B n=1 Tax=Thermosyntropha lipolytica DSM 11003 TaxID=1123382 RepID=A0A1M5N3E0_9FIRM|nr:nucleoside recognition domain-containing protein [Thermosyntropha lipolytica]SHG84080.1 ferrous iron transport protein B [Thermosyntropha lipolytica DSM 11003]